jgi:IclR family KDG regulon transcriptional repressor
MTEGRDYNISVLDHALRALELLLIDEQQGMSLSELAAQLGITKSRTFRILSTLQQQGFVSQDGERRTYRLGLKLLTFGEAIRRQTQLPQVAAPILDDLAATTGETVFLGVADGIEVVCIDKRESSHPVRLYAEVGRRAPLHAGGVPKTLLAYLALEQPDLLERIPLLPVTPETQTDRAQLAAELARIRAQGYVIATNDLDPGVSSVAAPIRDHTSRVIAAVSVAGPNDRVLQDGAAPLHLVHTVVSAAAAISRGMGHANDVASDAHGGGAPDAR